MLNRATTHTVLSVVSILYLYNNHYSLMPLPAGFKNLGRWACRTNEVLEQKSISDISIRCVEIAVGTSVDTVSYSDISEVQYQVCSVPITEKEVLAKPAYSTVSWLSSRLKKVVWINWGSWPWSTVEAFEKDPAPPSRKSGARVHNEFQIQRMM